MRTLQGSLAAAPLRRPQVLALMLLAAALWFLTHSYVGFDYHDTRIYTVLALHWLHPEAYARDPFFLFGSQDSLSLFSPLYGSLIKFMGIDLAGKLILLVGLAAWLLAALLLARVLLTQPLAQATAVLAMAVCAQNYSPNLSTFVINEPFATARSLAFPLGALAFAMGLRGRLHIALLLATAALLIHPLLGIWVFAVGLLWKLPTRYGAGLTVLCVLLVSGFGLSGWGPFAWFTPEWVDFIRTYARDVMVGGQGGPRYDAVVLYLGLLLLAARMVDSAAVRRFYLCAALVSGAGFVATLLCSYWLPAKLLIQAQLWRSMWVAALLSPFAAAQIFFTSWHWRSAGETDFPWHRSVAPWLALAGLTLLLMFPDHAGILLAPVCAYAWCGSARWLSTSLAWLERHVSYVRICTVLIVALALPAYLIEQQIQADSIGRPYIDGVSSWVAFLVKGGGGPGFLILAALSLFVSSLLRLFPILLLCLLCAWGWDVRDGKEMQWVDQISRGERGELGRLIQPGQVVLWGQRMPIRAWYELGTAHYAGPTQAVGFVFSTDKAVELLRRRDRVRDAYAQELALGYKDMEASPYDAELEGVFSFRMPRTVVGVQHLCRDPELDWVVIDKPISHDPVAVMVFDSLVGVSIAAYRCDDLRG